MKDIKNVCIVISLDFDLLWGVFDQIKLEEKGDYFQNTRMVIPRILDVFKRNNIHATGATVGMLFNNNWEEWESNIPKDFPTYSNNDLSAYVFGKQIKKNNSEEFCFAPNLISLISNTEGQEVATHTYSHYYCQEPGQETFQFKEDLIKAIEIAGKMNISLKSLVFPRNQIKNEYLEICFELDILNVRSNPAAWYWKDATSSNIITKLSRTGDAYFNLGKKSYSWNQIEKKPGQPILQMASRFLRPVENSELLRKSKIARIFNEMELAARKKEIYHLWWHPHNFGDRPEESLVDLIKILEKYKSLHSKFGFQTFNIMEIGELVS